MAKSKVEEGETFSLNEIVDFIGSVEQGTVTCAWSTTTQLPRDISILDFSSIQLNATTDLAINCAKMGITNKQEEYKKNCETHYRGDEVQINYKALNIFYFRFHLYLFCNLSISPYLKIFSISPNISQYI